MNWKLRNRREKQVLQDKNKALEGEKQVLQDRNEILQCENTDLYKCKAEMTKDPLEGPHSQSLASERG